MGTCGREAQVAPELHGQPTTSPLMRRFMLSLLCGALATASVTRPAECQTIRPDSGTQVRILLAHRDHYIVGRLLAPPGDTVIARSSSGRVFRIPRGRVALLQVGARGSRTGSTLAGIGIGLLGGAALGAAIGPALAGPPDAVFDENFQSAIGAILFGTVGGMTGGIVGYNRGGTRWRDVPLSASAGTRGVRVSVAF